MAAQVETHHAEAGKGIVGELTVPAQPALTKPADRPAPRLRERCQARDGVQAEVLNEIIDDVVSGVEAQGSVQARPQDASSI